MPLILLALIGIAAGLLLAPLVNRRPDAPADTLAGVAGALAARGLMRLFLVGGGPGVRLGAVAAGALMAVWLSARSRPEGHRR
jgi:uncharacterized membrane protein YeaQ/YmgE (transglycosylase-associated protein family)